MFRLVILTFHGEPKDQHKYDHAKESPFAMVMPLLFLPVYLFLYGIPLPYKSAIRMVFIKLDQSSWNFCTAGWQVWFYEVRWNYRITCPGRQAGFANYRITEFKHHHKIWKFSNHEVVYSEAYTEAMARCTLPAMFLSLLVAGAGILLAFSFYYWKSLMWISWLPG